MDEFTKDWLNDLLLSVKRHTDEKTWSAIMNDCSLRCSDHWIIKAKVLRNTSDNKNIDALIKSFKSILPGDSSGLVRKNDIIMWDFQNDTCPCPIAGFIKDKSLQCQCSIAHVKLMLEALLNKSLEVNLISSFHRDGKSCMFEVCGIYKTSG